jgi:hypothetical protein
MDVTVLVGGVAGTAQPASMQIDKKAIWVRPTLIDFHLNSYKIIPN